MDSIEDALIKVFFVHSFNGKTGFDRFGVSVMFVFAISFAVGCNGSEMLSHDAISIPTPMAAGTD